VNGPAPAASGGEADLAGLLASMDPVLDPATHVVVCVPAGSPLPEVATAVTVAEREGTTLVLDREQLVDGRLPGWDGPDLHPSTPMARVTLRVHSSLEAVGLTAAGAGALTEVGISCNVVAGFHHDHLFVPADRATDTLEALRAVVARATP
jgi:hypothetical protein